MSRLVIPSITPFATYAPGHSRAAGVLTVVPFLGLARELAALLLPVRPRPQFRAELERSLLAAARQQNARRAVSGFMPAAASYGGRLTLLERRWVIGAAAAAVGSAVSIAGIVAFVLHRRGEHAA